MYFFINASNEDCKRHRIARRDVIQEQKCHHAILDRMRLLFGKSCYGRELVNENKLHFVSWI